jgi:hypothetical protein
MTAPWERFMSFGLLVVVESWYVSWNCTCQGRSWYLETCETWVLNIWMGFVAFLVFPVFGKHIFACFGCGFSLKHCRSYMCTWFYLHQLWLLIDYCCLPACNLCQLSNNSCCGSRWTHVLKFVPQGSLSCAIAVILLFLPVMYLLWSWDDHIRDHTCFMGDSESICVGYMVRSENVGALLVYLLMFLVMSCRKACLKCWSFSGSVFSGVIVLLIQLFCESIW